MLVADAGPGVATRPRGGTLDDDRNHGGDLARNVVLFAVGSLIARDAIEVGTRRAMGTMPACAHCRAEIRRPGLCGPCWRRANPLSVPTFHLRMTIAAVFGLLALVSYSESGISWLLTLPIALAFAVSAARRRPVAPQPAPPPRPPPPLEPETPYAPSLGAAWNAARPCVPRTDLDTPPLLEPPAEPHAGPGTGPGRT